MSAATAISHAGASSDWLRTICGCSVTQDRKLHQNEGRNRSGSREVNRLVLRPRPPRRPRTRELIDDELTLKFAIAGTPEECVHQLRAILALGFASVSCNLAAVKRPHNTMTEGMRETLLGAGVVISTLRSFTGTSTSLDTSPITAEKPG